MNIVKNRKIFYILSSVLIVASFLSVFVFGLNFGIDFTGGSALDFEYRNNNVSVDVNNPTKDQVDEVLSNFDLGSYVLREVGGPEENSFSLKSKVIDDSTKNSIIEALSFEGREIEVKRFNTIGPTLGNELRTKASVALLILAVAIILFIAYTFRHVSKPVSSWKYGFVAIFALIHDVIITVGFFSLLGYFYGVEINTLFVTALLVILGYSINDTIVVLDRVRENLRDKDLNLVKARFSEIVNQSLNETFARSINTSLTTLLALLALLFIGGESTRDFALALVIGVISGAYSSIFLAAPLLVTFKEKQDRKNK